MIRSRKNAWEDACSHFSTHWPVGMVMWGKVKRLHSRAYTAINQPDSKIYHSHIRLPPYPAFSCMTGLIPWIPSQLQTLLAHQASLTLFGLLGNQVSWLTPACLWLSRGQCPVTCWWADGFEKIIIHLNEINQWINMTWSQIKIGGILQNRSRNRIGVGWVSGLNIVSDVGMSSGLTFKGPQFRERTSELKMMQKKNQQNCKQTCLMIAT